MTGAPASLNASSRPPFRPSGAAPDGLRPSGRAEGERPAQADGGAQGLQLDVVAGEPEVAHAAVAVGPPHGREHALHPGPHRRHRLVGPGPPRLEGPAAPRLYMIRGSVPRSRSPARRASLSNALHGASPVNRVGAGG